MPRSIVVVALAMALISVGTALDGGWATVKLSSSPKGMSAGQAWVVETGVS